MRAWVTRFLARDLPDPPKVSTDYFEGRMARVVRRHIQKPSTDTMPPLAPVEATHDIKPTVQSYHGPATGASEFSEFPIEARTLILNCMNSANLAGPNIP